MGDFVEQTSVTEVEAPVPEGRQSETSARHFRATLGSDWQTWGPAGGYVAAVALRAAGMATAFDRPASFACQFLSVARFEEVELRVESRRAGRRTEALRIAMAQQGVPVLDATVWAVSENEGLEHDYTRPAAVSPPADLQDVRELMPQQ